MTDYKWSDYKLWICSFLPALTARILCIIENELLNAIYLSCLGFSLEVGLILQVFNRYHTWFLSSIKLAKVQSLAAFVVCVVCVKLLAVFLPPEEVPVKPLNHEPLLSMMVANLTSVN